MAAGLTDCARVTRKNTRDGATSVLLARPAETASGREPGLHSLNVRPRRDSLLYVPKIARLEQPAPLLVFLHGAGGPAQQGIRRLSSFADEFGFLLLAPASQGDTWDAVEKGYGPDVRVIDEALARTFGSCRVEASRIGLSGFSDGASYALGLGLANGDLFRQVLAFSPGFIPPGAKPSGKPRIFLSHGTNDEILPIANCSRRLAPELRRTGYQVTYREFEGPHTIPREITVEAIRWFLA